MVFQLLLGLLGTQVSEYTVVTCISFGPVFPSYCVEIGYGIGKWEMRGGGGG